MKIILLFALFGLSFCSDGDTDCPITKPNPNADDPNCLALAVENLGYLWGAVGKYLCAYNKFKEDQNIENYNAGAEIFIKAVKCIGCHVDNILGTGNGIEKILVPAGESATEALKAVLEVLKLLQIDEIKAKLLCLLAGDLLQSPCLKDALVNIAPDILLNLKKLYCELTDTSVTDSDAAAAAAAGVSQLLGKLACALEKQLGFKEGELENALKTLSREALQGLVEKLLLLTGKVGLVSEVLCHLVILLFFNRTSYLTDVAVNQPFAWRSW